MISEPRSPFPLPVLMYHDVVDSIDDVPSGHRPYALTGQTFAAQLQALTALGVAGTRLDAHLVDDPCPGTPPRVCVLTFDDGHESNYTRALPLLQAAGCRATFFITTGWIGKAPYMSWEQIRGLAAAGMEIGSHSVTHRPPATLSRDDLLAELRDSRRHLEDRLGRPVVSASSPTGFFNPLMMAAARESGYGALCCGRIALWRGMEERFAIPRLAVKSGATLSEVGRLALGERRLIARLRRRQVMRDTLKKSLGIERYLRLRRALLGLGSRRP